MKPLNNLNKLYIRACKSKNPQKRLRSIYRRFYFYQPAIQDEVIANNLAAIVEEYNLLTISKLTQALDPCNDYCYSGDDPKSHWNRIMVAMWQAIRYTHRDDLPDFLTPDKK